MKKILTFSSLCVVIFLLQFSITNAQTWQEMMDSSITYQKAQDYQTSLKWAMQAETKAKEEFGEMDTHYIGSLQVIQQCYYYMGNSQKAIEYSEKLNPLIEQVWGKDSWEYAQAIGNLGFLYNAVGDYSKAEPLYIEAFEMTKLLFKTDHQSKVWSINNLAAFYNARGDYSKAEPLMIEALEMSRRIFKTDHTSLIISITNLATFYHGKGDYNKAEPLFIEALEMCRRIFKTDHPYLATCINNMAMFYKDKGDFSKAEPLFNENLKIRERLYKTDSQGLARSIENMAGFYHARGDYIKAESLYIEALEKFRIIFKTDHPDLAKSINNIAVLYYDMGDYTKAEAFYRENLEMCRRIFKTDYPQLAGSINNMAGFYHAMGDYSKAEPLYNEALEMYRRIFKTDHPDLSRSLNNTAGFYHARGDYSKAESLYIEALEMIRRIFKTDHQDLARSINNMATFYHDMRDYTKAESLYSENLEMCRRIFKTDNPYLARSINNLATFYEGMADYSKSEPLYTEAMEMYRRIYKTDHQYLAQTINYLAELFHNSYNDSRAEPLYFETLEMYKNVFEKQSISLSQSEKEKYWNTMKKVFEKFLSFASIRSKENPQVLSKMYDNQLYTKALLYNSTTKIKNRVLNSGDSTLISQYRKWSDMKELLVSLYKMTANELKMKNFNIDSVENVANDLEKQISLKSEDFKQSYEKKKVSWKTIQAILKPDEAAVEVVRFRYSSKSKWTDTIYYAFLIVTNETEDHPELVLIEDGNKLENEWYNEYRNMVKIKGKDAVSYSRFWGKLNDKLKDYKKIYFSPDGIYNKLNPSTLMLPDGKFLLDFQDIQQVNSTKDLLLGYYQTKQESNLLNSAVLIGNPNFGLEEEKVKETARKIRGEKQDERTLDQFSNVRGLQLTKLPGTEREIKDIEKLLKAKNWLINSYLGDMAIKTAVKSASNPRILHIATHGLFLEDVKHNSKDMFGFEEQKLKENPLLRSGLFFTGADNYLKNTETITKTEENGLLTAFEAMNLNLDKTELVVLSACETGLGEIQNGEGVFGLRRAFQQAGARTILMSLWKVSDDATQMLMSNFYKNWVSGMTKRESFSKAQQQVRAKFPEPYFWGAFVMVGE